MARFKDHVWSLPERITVWDEAIVAALMDIRDELKVLNRIIGCHNTIRIPGILERIESNTKKREYRRRKK